MPVSIPCLRFTSGVPLESNEALEFKSSLFLLNPSLGISFLTNLISSALFFKISVVANTASLFNLYSFLTLSMYLDKKSRTPCVSLDTDSASKN